MPSENEMLADLDAADKAGDSQLAQHIAGQIKASRVAGPSAQESLLRGGAQGATFGSGDEIQGLVQAAGIKNLPSALGGGRNTLVPWQKEFYDKDVPGSFFSKEGAPPSKTDTQSLGDLYREQRDVARRDDKAAKEANPGSYLLGNLAGSLLPAAATMGGSAAPQGAAKVPLLTRLLKAGLTGAAYGGAAAAGDSEADLTKGEGGAFAKDVGKGATIGAGVGTGLTAVGAGGTRALRGLVKLSDENTFLRSKGVDLTLGQAAPKSWYNSAEQAAESLPILGDLIKAQRQAGRSSWQRAVVNEAAAPGAAPLAGNSPASMLKAAADSFDAAYKPIAAEPAQAAVGGRPLAQALQDAAADPKVRATDAVRQSVAGFLDNAHSELIPTVGQRPLTAGDLISVRSQIRSEIRNELSGSQPDYAAARLLRNGEQAVSDALKEHLSPQGAQALAATDAQYGKLMRVTDAVRRSGDQPGGFTPAQLSAAIKSGTEKSSYAQGAGGPLRQLASAGRTTLDTTSPPTGARILTLGVPGMRYPLGAILAAGTTDTGKKLLTGGTKAQLAIQPLLDLLEKTNLSKAAQGAAAAEGVNATQ